MSIPRRRFLSTLALGGAVLGLSPLFMCTKNKKPNVLFLFADDQRYDTVHALGNRDIITPTLDKLVNSGVSFSNAYIMGGNNGAVCMPSRAMLLTGRTLARLVEDGRVIPEDHVMMPEVFRQNGYTTFGTGKWHNGKRAYARCFDAGGEILFGGMSDHWNVPCYHFDPEGQYETVTPVIEHPWSSNEITFKNYDHITDGKHSSELFAEAAVNFIKSCSKKPFFMYVPFTAPHDPRSMPKEYLDMYDPGTIPLPANFKPRHPFDNGELEIRDEMLAPFPRTPGEIKKHIAAYYAMVTHLDAQIGRILQALHDSGEYENTLIIYSGDNGLAVGQHGLMGKQNVYEHSVHVPLIFSGPGLPVAERRKNPVYLLDIFPTLCELLGFEIPASVDGTGFAGAFFQTDYTGREAVVFGYKNFQKGIRTGRWKYIVYNVDGKRRRQLFDLQSDPMETENLCDRAENRTLVQELQEKLQKLLNASGDPVDFSKTDWGVGKIPKT
ncbi:sulfatase-like hydrolase/transferase [candidate division KSB1 bacterium]|nr:sulfatase-like hydrolase/transferase [candidate division KSB1 bacterium]